MKAQGEVKKELKINEDSLTDLPVGEDQAEGTRGGGDDKYKGETEILSWSFGESNPSTGSGTAG